MGLQIERLSKVFPGASRQGAGTGLVQALTEVSFAAEGGSLLVVLGPSGCGKTTLLRLIAGLETPTSGTISLNGKLLNHIPPGKRDIAMVFQNPALYPEMSARENLAFGLRVRGCPTSEASDRVNRVSTMLGLDDCLHRRPHELSGGERQRVALGRALVRRPELILMDEPLANLDAPARDELRREIVRIQRRVGATMVYVTHDQTEALTLADRLLVFERGCIAQSGSPAEVYERPASLFVAGFVGSPRINLLRCRIVVKGSGCFMETPGTGGGAGLVLDATEIAARPGLVPGKECVLGIRPEQIRVGPDETGARWGAEFGAVVRAVEFAGPDSLVQVEAGPAVLTARVPGRTQLTTGARVFAAIDLEKAGLFDAESGKNLCGY